MRVWMLVGWMVVFASGCSPRPTLAPAPLPTTIPATSTSQAPAATTTAVAGQTAPQPSPDRAASVFLDAWRRNDLAAARAVATEAAVAGLFGHPKGSVQPRGCQEPLGPAADCSFGLNGALLTLHTVSPGPGLWIIDSVRFDG